MELPDNVLQNRQEADGKPLCWDTKSFHEAICEAQGEQTLRSTERLLERSDLLPAVLKLSDLVDEFGRGARIKVAESLDQQARRKRHQSLIVQLIAMPDGRGLLFANDARAGRRWVFVDHSKLDEVELLSALDVLIGDKPAMLWPHGDIVASFRSITDRAGSHDVQLPSGISVRLGTMVFFDTDLFSGQHSGARKQPSVGDLSPLDQL